MLASVLAYVHVIGQQIQNRPQSVLSAPAPTGTIQSTPAAYPGTIPLNHVRTFQALTPITDYNTLITQSFTHVKQSTVYVDGLGRPIQSVSKQATPGSSPKDVVKPMIYDELGREQYQYLPYVSTSSNGAFKSDPFAEQATYYGQSQFNGEDVFYSKTDFEASPLSRPLKSHSPGNSWAGSDRGVEMKYLVNTIDDGVRIWNMVNDVPVSGTSDIYPAGTLYKNVTIDEHNNAVVEYKDKSGNVILKKVQIGSVPADYSGHTEWLCTYYVYDDLNRLCFVISPKAVANLIKTHVNWDITYNNNVLINELCFQYKYDSRSRMVEKKVPGAAWVYMVYDNRDRLVFTQDGNMRANDQWLVTLYDALNRPLITGMIVYTGTLTDLQSHVTGLPAGDGTIPINGPFPSIGLPPLLVISGLETGVRTHRAQEEIIFDPGFTTDNNTGLTAEIEPGSTPVSQQTFDISINPIPPSSASSLIALTITHYDNYNWTNTAYNTVNNSKLEAGTNLHAVPLPNSAQQQAIPVKGMVTGTRVRTLVNPGNLSLGEWLTSHIFYDKYGRVIQSQNQTLKGTDVATNLYDFSGKLLCNYLVHSNNEIQDVAQQKTSVKTCMEYDHTGALLKVFKTINEDVANKKLIAEHEYDELGQLKIKRLGNTASNDPLEILNYEYNIRGWMQGINLDYARGATNTNWFGMELNYDWGFEANQYNGNISGTKWRSKGDGEQRSYGFGYDKANRLMFADFNQYTNSEWNRSAGVNFTSIMGDGIDHSKAYDENGNILAMKQWGLKLTSSSVIDELHYTYSHNGISNKLQNVIDLANDATTKLGDFRTSVNSTNASTKTSFVLGTSDPYPIVDYTYDVNGNMVQDLNKDIVSQSGDGIVYNHLNLPFKVTVKKDATTEKGHIKYIYDASGVKLRKITTEAETTVTHNGSTFTTSIVTTTDYIGGFIYESKSYSNTNLASLAYSNKLQFFAHEEGRTRPKEDNNEITFVYDYFIKDHLGNVRMVLTDEEKVDIYPMASLEDAKLQIESNYYNIQTGSIRDITLNPIPGLPSYTNDNGIGNIPSDLSFENTNSNKVYTLNGNGVKTGLGISLKVMAGDKVSVFGKSYYNHSGGFTNNQSISIDDILGGFLNSPATITTQGLHGGVNVSQLNVIPLNINVITSFLSQNEDEANNPNNLKPQAFINYLFFDEQFKLVTGGASIVGSNGQLKEHFQDLQNLVAQKNGFLYIYCSNESSIDVFFDNLQVTHTPGPLLEETHYYPFGLTMAGISSKAAGITPNKEKTFQDQRFDDDLGLNWVQFKWRNHDPQIGRFIEIDPLSNDYVYNSTYAFSENQVTGHVELEGLEKVSVNNLLTINSSPMHHKKDLSTVNLSLSAVLQGSNKTEISVGDNSNAVKDFLGTFNSTISEGNRIHAVSQINTQVTPTIIENDAGQFLAITTTTTSTTVNLEQTKITSINTTTTSVTSYSPIVNIDKAGNSIAVSATEGFSGKPISKINQFKLSDTPSENLKLLSPELQKATQQAILSNAANAAAQEKTLSESLDNLQKL
jgi:RHS repeat-associated protein